jgi:hypothetical protein
MRTDFMDMLKGFKNMNGKTITFISILSIILPFSQSLLAEGTAVQDSSHHEGDIVNARVTSQNQEVSAASISRQSLNLLTPSIHQPIQKLQRVPRLKSNSAQANVMSPEMLKDKKNKDGQAFETNMPGANQPKDIGYAVSSTLFQQLMPGATPSVGAGAALSVSEEFIDPEEAVLPISNDQINQ